MLADIAQWQLRHIHPVDNERAGNPYTPACVVCAEFLVFGQ
jgi:hypothetical protein